MLTAKIALAAALTLVSGAAFAASSHQTRVDMERVAVTRTAMERIVVDQPRAITGFRASEPTIFGHAPLTQTYGLPHHNGS